MESAAGGLGFRDWKRMWKLPPSVGDDTWAAKGIRILQLEFRQRKITSKTEWKGELEPGSYANILVFGVPMLVGLLGFVRT